MVTSALAIAALVSFCKQVFPDKVTGWVTIVVAIILGVLHELAKTSVHAGIVVTGVESALVIVGGMTIVDRVRGD